MAVSGPTPGVSRSHLCKIRHLPLDCHCNPGVNSQYRRGINGKRLLTAQLPEVGDDPAVVALLGDDEEAEGSRRLLRTATPDINHTLSIQDVL
jgi:hypothetical protein